VFGSDVVVTESESFTEGRLECFLGFSREREVSFWGPDAGWCEFSEEGAELCWAHVAFLEHCEGDTALT
jgi:hypothetical protein